MSPLDEQVFTKAAAKLAPCRRPLLISHARPDGDALGSLIAMRSLLGLRGADPTVLLLDTLPDRYAVFHRYPPMSVWGVDLFEPDLADVDGVIILDTCTYNQLAPIADWLRSAALPKLAVDHHITRDELADTYVIDEAAAATCLILYQWAQALDWPMTAEASEALFIGMAMDTGWFQHANTDQTVLAAAADLVTYGVRSHELYQQLFQRESPARVRLLGVAVNTLELLAKDRLSVMTLSSEAIAEASATPADTEDIVNEPLRIGSVVVSVLLVQEKHDLVRVSFRSKSPLDVRCPIPSQQGRRTDTGTPDVDVAKVAQAFGGGGHSRAAGARLSGTLDDIRNRIVAHLEPLLSD